VNYEIPEGVEIAVEKNIITIKGSDKQQIGQIAQRFESSDLLSLYKGKGVKYSDETHHPKAGRLLRVRIGMLEKVLKRKKASVLSVNFAFEARFRHRPKT
jgi:hypothetical protein